MLETKGLSVKYGTLPALTEISINVKEREFIAVVGPNGAGKTTLLITIAGILKPVSGSVNFLGKKIDALPAHRIADFGIGLVPEGRPCFPYMNVIDNLILGAYLPRCKKNRTENIKRVFDLFPVLEERKKQLAITLSGGEQQMLAIARALMSEPKLLMLDEPSLGLSPLLVGRVFETLKRLNDEGVTILLVEQNVLQSLEAAKRGYVIERGSIALEGPDLLQNEHLKKAYLGI